MDTWLIFILLLIGAYLLGSIPVSQIVARLYRGIDLREYGTGQIGGGNLWRMTSWRLGLPVGLYDATKGIIMVVAANLAGLDIAQQILVGSGAIIGHNWSVFNRFSGGRGIATTGGIVLILPIINEMTPWATVISLSIVAVGSIVLRTSPLAVLVSIVTLPIVSWVYHEPVTVILSFLAIFFIVIIKRLTAPLSAEAASLSKRTLLLNRFLFDRDVTDRKFWMYRNFPARKNRRKTS